MSLPIPTAALIRGATSFASDVANRVGQAIGFDDVLRGVNVDQGKDVAAMTDSLVEAVETRLSQSGIVVNQPLRLSVMSNGTLRVEGNHARAAQIEALLASDETLSKTARNLIRAGGPSEIVIGQQSPSGLTPTGVEANIREMFGG